MRKMHTAFAAAGCAAALSLVAACGSGASGNDTASAGTPTASKALNAQLPAAIRSAGTITFAIQEHPPYTVIDGSSATGPNIDLQNAIAAELGLKVQTQDVEGGITPVLAGILSGRYEGFSGPAAVPAGQSAQFDLVNWTFGHAAYLVEKSQVSSSDATALCGTSVASLLDSAINPGLTALSDYCVKLGKQAIKELPLATTNDAVLAVKSGRASAMITTSGTAGATAQADSTLKVLQQPAGAPTPALNLGFLLPKNGLATPFLAALKDLIKNGTYDQIMKKYGLQGDEVTTPQINPPAHTAS